MNCFNILLFVGTRPEIIKLAPVYHHLKKHKHFNPEICFTGQHRDLAPAMMDEFALAANYQQKIPDDLHQLEDITKNLLSNLPAVLQQAKPDLCIVQGDTTSAFAAAVTSQKAAIPVAHIEAGLRTYDVNAPFPEEVNRQNITKLSNWHFCPTQMAREHLISENIAPDTIFVTGNTAIDSLMKYHSQSLQKPERPYFLITLHRRESHGAPLLQILEGLKTAAAEHTEFDFIFCSHPNPTVSQALNSLLTDCPNINLIPPQSYTDFIKLMANAYTILTDSGGIQEEAPSLNIPVLVLRDKSERQEGIKSGCLILAGTDPKNIRNHIDQIIHDQDHYDQICSSPNPFGSGQAAKKIVAHLENIYAP